MDLITIDIETYYDKEFSLSKMTTEEYIRDPRFEVIGVSVKVNNGPTEWASGRHDEIKDYLDTFNWANSMVLAHNTMFDGAILSWLFDVRPRVWADTLCIARALHGLNVSGSLKALAVKYGIGEKGNEVVNALGKRREDFSDYELEKYGDYCVNDVELTYNLFKIMGRDFPRQELRLIDLTLRMFIEPVLDLDLDLLEQHMYNVKIRKEKLLKTVGVDKKELMSNQKFAELLRELGVTPPTKVSKTTGKETFAFAKTDEGFTALLEHDDDRVQTLATARLGTKSTLEETRTQRFIDIANRGLLPVPVRYYAAHTGRWGGDDKINLQNLPSRGPNGKMLKKSIIAPKGYMLVDCDSSQIEARVLAWLAGQDDLVEAFQEGRDVYKKMASAIYNVPEDKVTAAQRFVGKTTILGCIAAGTKVLCETGWKPIEQVTTADRLWDGENWVCHQGLLEKGLKETVNLCGSWLTPDHKILCGTQWKETQSVVQDENTLSQALATGAAKLPLEALSGECGEALSQLSLRATADDPNTQLTGTTLKTLRLQGVRSVLNKLAVGRGIGGMPSLCQMIPTGQDYSTDFLLLSHGAITQEAIATKTTGAGVYKFIMSGEKTEQSSSRMYRRLKGGMTRVWKWTVSITTKGMNQIIYGSQPEVKTCETLEASKSCRKRLMTYDLAYAGPNNRFTIWTDNGPVIAHNCGYGMGAVRFQDQLKSFGTEIDLDEARRIVDVYRKTNHKISQFWKDAQQTLINMSQGRKFNLGKSLEVVPEEYAIRLPSGLLMRYEDLQFEQNEKGLQFDYKTRRGRVKIYGGKVTENVCQGIARCIIGEQMLAIAKRYRVVLTVHDSVVCCVPEDELTVAQGYIEQCMRLVPKWAEGMPINCESGTGTSYGDCE